MKKSVLCGIVAAMAILAFSITGAQAAFVTFSNIADGDGNTQFFDVTATSATGNTLNIGLNNFTADNDSGINSALDTLSFTVTAPAGFWITKVTYNEEGTGETSNGLAVAGGSITAGGIPKNFATVLFSGLSGGDWALSGDVPIANASEINVSVVNSLFAVAFGGPDDVANITKTLGSVSVDITPVPIPSTLLLLGGGLLGVFGLKRRRS